jgi:hypothetical protein
MAHEIKTHPDHPHSMEERVQRRLRPSAGDVGDRPQVTTGNSPNRTITTLHHGGAVRKHGEVNSGEGDIHGHKRGVV